jgi:hypothetical protein
LSALSTREKVGDFSVDDDGAENGKCGVRFSFQWGRGCLGCPLVASRTGRILFRGTDMGMDMGMGIKGSFIGLFLHYLIMSKVN